MIGTMTKHLLFSCVGLLLLVGGLAVPTTALAEDQVHPSGANLIVQPESDQPQEEIRLGYFRLSLGSGEMRAVRLAVKNSGQEPMAVLAYPVDAYQLPGGGIDFQTLGKPQEGVSSWITLDKSEVAIIPGEDQRVVATVRVPEGLAPGDYVGGLAVEDQRVQSQGMGSSVMIDFHYRRVVAVLVMVPGPRSPSLEVDKVTLVPNAGSGSALLTLRNAGNVLLKGKGSVVIGGQEGQGKKVDFTLDTLIPQAQAEVKVPLPGVVLEPGLYNATVQVDSDEYGQLVAWQGTATAAETRPNEAQSEPASILLEPVQAAAASASNNPWIWMGGALLVLAAGIGFGLAFSRLWNARRSRGLQG